ncbi:MAG: cytochrome P450 [Candidatus Limnocylindria bacterium]
MFFAPDLGGWLVTRREDVVAALADPAGFSSAGNLSMPPPPAQLRERLPHGYPWATPALANGDPPEHTRLRKLVNAAFSRARVRRLEPAVHGIASELVARLPAQGGADAIADLARPLAERSLALAIGYPEPELEALRRWLSALDVTNAHAGDTDSPALVTAAEEHARFAERCTALVAASRDGDDLLARLGRAEITATRAQSVVMQVVMAGVATTAHTIAHCLKALLEVPSRWQALRARPAGMAAVIEESLRYRSTVRGMPRTVTRDVELGGAQLAAGDCVWLLFASANRDGADADEFAPDRVDWRSHLAFGRGRHFCPGAPLARLETAAALTALLPLDGLRLDDGEPLTPHPTFPIDALVRLPVRWSPPAP